MSNRSSDEPPPAVQRSQERLHFACGARKMRSALVGVEASQELHGCFAPPSSTTFRPPDGAAPLASKQLKVHDLLIKMFSRRCRTMKQDWDDNSVARTRRNFCVLTFSVVLVAAAPPNGQG